MSNEGERSHRKAKARERERARLLRALAACDGDPADMLELYYWSKEPGFTQLIRAIATMPEHTRATLETFIVLARDSRSVKAALDSRGVLTFCSAEAAKSAALAVHAVNEADDRPQLLN
ncbi:MAG: hypothetical protein WCE79_08425 [Xanthobacteraceae bacterium]